jgi:hypothetical protein
MIFLDDSINLDSISQELIKRLPPDLDAAKDDGRWTKAMAEGLEKIAKGTEARFYVCGHGCEQGQSGEWLLDHLWMVNEDWRTVLAVESEWVSTKTAIQEDFGKLMCIKARHKLLFFKARDQAHADVLMKEAVEYLMQAYPYHLAGEEYMAMARTTQGALRYWFEVPSDGLHKSAHFKQMSTLPWPWAAIATDQQEALLI